MSAGEQSERTSISSKKSYGRAAKEKEGRAQRKEIG